MLVDMMSVISIGKKDIFLSTNQSIQSYPQLPTNSYNLPLNSNSSTFFGNYTRLKYTQRPQLSKVEILTLWPHPVNTENLFSHYPLR